MVFLFTCFFILCVTDCSDTNPCPDYHTCILGTCQPEACGLPVDFSGVLWENPIHPIQIGSILSFKCSKGLIFSSEEKSIDLICRVKQQEIKEGSGIEHIKEFVQLDGKKAPTCMQGK